MPMRLALVANAAMDGPWVPACGDESAVKITGLHEGEHIEVWMRCGDSSESLTLAESGVFPLPWSKVDHYRACKFTNVGRSLTMVELVGVNADD